MKRKIVIQVSSNRELSSIYLLSTRNLLFISVELSYMIIDLFDFYNIIIGVCNSNYKRDQTYKIRNVLFMLCKVNNIKTRRNDVRGY